MGTEDQGRRWWKEETVGKAILIFIIQVNKLAWQRQRCKDMDRDK